MKINQTISIWPEWEVIEQLGEGSFGKVYKAKRTERDTIFYSAIKVITIPQNQSEVSSVCSEHVTKESARTYFQKIVDECINEVKILESLKGTAHIISVDDYQVIEYDDEIKWDICIRMELSANFMTYAAEKKLDENEVIQMGIDICSALECCTKLNIIHRDIKPENIFISKFGQYKLGDFGIARKLERIPGGLSQKGTYFYMAPEIYNGRSYGSNIDTYSLGIVLYKLLNNNRIPFLNPKKQQLTYQDKEAALVRRISGEKLPPPCEASPQMTSVILKSCSYSPSDRYGSPTEMKQALLAVQDGVTLKMNMNQIVGVQKAPSINTEYHNAVAGQYLHNLDRQENPQVIDKPRQSKIPRLMVGITAGVILMAGGFWAGKTIFDKNKGSQQPAAKSETVQEEAVADEQQPLETTKVEGEVSGTPAQETIILNQEQVTEAADQSEAASVDGIIYQADVYEYLTLREAPSTSAPALCLLPPYTRMQIIEDTNSMMVKVTTIDNHIIGYANKEYLTPSGAIMQRAGKQQDTYSDLTIYYADVYETMTLRNASSTNADPIAYLAPYTAMYILEESNGMADVYVMDSGLEGWVNTEYLTSDVHSFVRAGKRSGSGTADTYEAGQICYAAVNEFLTLRNQPSTSGTEIAKLMPETEMVILEVSNAKFCRVRVSDTDQIGYVMSEYLRK